MGSDKQETLFFQLLLLGELGVLSTVVVFWHCVLFLRFALLFEGMSALQFPSFPSLPPRSPIRTLKKLPFVFTHMAQTNAAFF